MKRGRHVMHIKNDGVKMGRYVRGKGTKSREDIKHLDTLRHVRKVCTKLPKKRDLTHSNNTPLIQIWIVKHNTSAGK